MASNTTQCSIRTETTSSYAVAELVAYGAVALGVLIAAALSDTRYRAGTATTDEPAAPTFPGPGRGDVDSRRHSGRAERGARNPQVPAVATR